MMSIRRSEYCVESFIGTNHVLPSLSSDANFARKIFFRISLQILEDLS